MSEYKLFFDSNIWLRYFLPSDDKIGALVDSSRGRILTSVLSFHEVVKRLRKLKYNESAVSEAIRFMHESSMIVGVNETIVIDSTEWCLKHNLHTVDSILYQSARASDATFLTFDNDFRGLPYAEVLK